MIFSSEKFQAIVLDKNKFDYNSSPTSSRILLNCNNYINNVCESAASQPFKRQPHEILKHTHMKIYWIKFLTLKKP